MGPLGSNDNLLGNFSLHTLLGLVVGSVSLKLFWDPLLGFVFVVFNSFSA